MHEENHTMSFVAGNNKVGNDSFSPSTHWFPGYDLQHSPKISMFHGKEAPCKNEVSFEQWLFEVRLVQRLYSEPVLKEAVIRKLKGTVANLPRYYSASSRSRRNDFKVKNTVWNNSII